jgi:DUF2905 family protein
VLIRLVALPTSSTKLPRELDLLAALGFYVVCNNRPRYHILAMSRWLIVFGLVLIVLGLMWPLFTKMGLGRLPGDIVIERRNFRLYLRQ